MDSKDGILGVKLNHYYILWMDIDHAGVLREIACTHAETSSPPHKSADVMALSHQERAMARFDWTVNRDSLGLWICYYRCRVRSINSYLYMYCTRPCLPNTAAALLVVYRRLNHIWQQSNIARNPTPRGARLDKGKIRIVLNFLVDTHADWECFDRSTRSSLYFAVSLQRFKEIWVVNGDC